MNNNIQHSMDEDDLILFFHFIQWVFIINLVVGDVDHFIFANNMYSI